MAGHWPRRGGRVVLVPAQGTARPLFRKSARRVRLDLGRRAGSWRSPRRLLAYSALAWYDRIALMHLGRRISWRFVGLGVVHRLRDRAQYRRLRFVRRGHPLSRLFDQGTERRRDRRAGRLLLVHLRARRGDARRPVAALPPGTRRALRRRAGLARQGRRRRSSSRVPGLFVIGSLLHFRPFKLGGFELVYPRPPVAARQLLAGPLELVGAAGIIFFALPAAANPGFLVVLGVFLASFSLALVSHAPGGLGVLEIAFLEGMPDAPQGQCRGGASRVPPALSDPAAHFRARRRSGVRAPSLAALVPLKRRSRPCRRRSRLTTTMSCWSIDLQADFMPGGALAVGEGDAIVPLVNALVERFAHVVVTQDWHPPGHASFASSHEGAAPFETKRPALRRARPCGRTIASRGPRARRSIPDLATDRAFLILRKGMHPGVDSYSAFVEADGKTTTGLAALLKARGVKRVFACGLATDYCVAFSALDARKRRVRDFRHRGRLPGDRRQQFARRRLGAHERGRGLAHPVARTFSGGEHGRQRH